MPTVPARSTRPDATEYQPFYASYIAGVPEDDVLAALRSSGRQLATMFGAVPESRALAISPDGKQVAAAAGSTVRLWETATGKELPLLGGHRQAPAAIALSGDGQTVVSWGADRVVRRWEASTGKSLGEFAAPPGTTQAAFSADGRIVALANADNTIRLHDVASGKQLKQVLIRPEKGTATPRAPAGFAVGFVAPGIGLVQDETLRLVSYGYVDLDR